MLVAQLPRKVPSSCAIDKLPELSKLNSLLARSVADTVNSELAITFVRDPLIARLSSSSCFCVINTNLSNASSKLSAGNGSLATKSKPCVSGCSRKITTVTPFAGAVPNTTLPPLADPTPVTV